MEKLKLLVKGLIMNVVFASILFVSVGKLSFIQGWIYLAANALATIMNVLTVTNIETIKERSTVKADAKAWDKKILGLSSLLYLVTIIVAGLDAGRFNWTPELPLGTFILGAFILLIGNAVFLTARNQNKFFSTIVRIQTDRGHTVCDTGLYKTVRHPWYLGMIISLLGVPVLLGSIWSVIPIIISVILLIIRTKLEDKTLVNELNGYMEYTKKTKYKLIPYIL